ncbi:MAG: type II toxin-antitoxin system prevent-host-death family antitoxin [Desulfosarcina sp.]|nr:type II toxin-antitoxin system prevent-host-death family antitoxin [Desulfosarcina sp.]
MIQAGIKEIKNNLSRFLAQVKAGEEVMITERGKPVARIIKENSQSLAIRTALAPLIEKGLVVLPNRSLKKDDLNCHQATGKLVSEMVSEDRR